MALILSDKKILLLTPNKCSSTTINETLIKELGAQLVLGPQGPWRKHQGFEDEIGKHSVVIPYIAKYWKKFIFWRNPFDRTVSLWRHYCKYSQHEIAFPHFIELVEGWRKEPPKMWFYCWRMSEIIEEAGPGIGVIEHNDFDTLNRVLNTTIKFPHLHKTEHGPWQSHYDPELMRRAYNIA
jgi:hypothetical protein